MVGGDGTGVDPERQKEEPRPGWEYRRLLWGWGFSLMGPSHLSRLCRAASGPTALFRNTKAAGAAIGGVKNMLLEWCRAMTRNYEVHRTGPRGAAGTLPQGGCAGRI